METGDIIKTIFSNVEGARQHFRKKQYTDLCKKNLKAHKTLLKLEQQKDELTQDHYGSIKLENERVIKEVEPKIELLKKAIDETDNSLQKHYDSQYIKKKKEEERYKRIAKLNLPKINKQLHSLHNELKITEEKIRELQKLSDIDLIDKDKYLNDVKPLKNEIKSLKTKIKRKKKIILKIDRL